METKDIKDLWNFLTDQIEKLDKKRKKLEVNLEECQDAISQIRNMRSNLKDDNENQEQKTTAEV